MRLSARLTVAVVLLMISLPALPTRAGTLKTPDGNPTPIPAGFTNISKTTPYIVNVTPDPAQLIEQGNCPWLLPALAAQGFAKVDKDNPRGYSGANGWTINFATLTGSFTLNNYYPWADKEPPFSVNGLGVTDRSKNGWGGSVMGLTYTAAGKDPTLANAEWIQVIRANDASAKEKKYGADAGGGFTYFLDDFWEGNTLATNGTGNPTYDGGYTKDGDKYTSKGWAANPTTFLDNPASALTAGLDVEFQVFLVTDDAANKKLTIYDGVWWGFKTDTPEPSSFILFGLGTLTLLGFVWRRRKRTIAVA